MNKAKDLTMTRQFVCTMSADRYQKPHCRWADVSDDGWVDDGWGDGGTPIEDFGMYYVLNEEISSDEVFQFFLKKIAEREDSSFCG
jgi:hypothetical protein